MPRGTCSLLSTVAIVGAVFAFASLASAEDLTPSERMRLDDEAQRATRHLDLFGRYVERARALRRTADLLRAANPATPAAQQEQDARLRHIEETLLPQTRERVQELGDLWDQRYMFRVGPIERYGTTFSVPHLEPSDDGSPGTIRHHDEDYLRYWIRTHYRLGEMPALLPLEPQLMKGAVLPPVPAVVSEPPPLASEPVRIPDTGKAIDDLTAEERRQALLDGVQEVWNQVTAWWYGSDPAQKEAAQEALGDIPAPPAPEGPAETAAEEAARQAAASAAETARREALRAKQVGSPDLEPWKKMTKEQRHWALLRNDPKAWDAVSALLKSGDAAAVEEVLQALSRLPKPLPPTPPPVAIGCEAGTLTVFVREEGQGGPFDEDAFSKPVPGTTIAWTYNVEGRQQNGTSTTDAEGVAVIRGLPVPVTVQVTWRGNVLEGGPTPDRPDNYVCFGPPPPVIPTGSTAPPEDLPPPPPPPPDED